MQHPRNPGFCLGRQMETDSSSSKQDETQRQFSTLDSGSSMATENLLIPADFVPSIWSDLLPTTKRITSVGNRGFERPPLKVFLAAYWGALAAADTDTLSSNQTLRDGQTLVSAGQLFELGLFTPASTSVRYLGIWYKNLPQTVVWVANRDNPIIVNGSAELVLGSNGSVSLQYGTVIYWSVTAGVQNDVLLQLLDDGNLVLRGVNTSASDVPLWQSFDNITDTLLPEMKLGWNLRTGLERRMTSWASSNDPSSSQFTFSLEPPESPQLVLKQGNQKLYRWGPWQGVRFSGSDELNSNPVFQPSFYSSADEVYYKYTVVDNSTTLRLIVTPDGLIQYSAWRNSNQWVPIVTLQRDNCDRYDICGPYGSCYSSSPNCRCLSGFTPTSPQNWNSLDWTDGCMRKFALNCSNNDGFVKYEGLKLPDFSYLSTNRSLSLKECQIICRQNCSCTAYTIIDIHGNGGDCVLWSGQLFDMKNYPDGGDVLYIRMARAELDAIARRKRRRLIVLVVCVTLSTICGLLVIGLAGWFLLQANKRRKKAKQAINRRFVRDGEGEEDLELPLFDIDVVATATDQFSFKIGQGGFGEVYRGALPSGQDIAVKRLSQNSGQGLKEFKNEVTLIAKLQHRNLVRLLGCCIQGEERMLIYEFLPNKSLDYHLFDHKRKRSLTWKMRSNIIMGVARGLLYLHEDSRLKIIHRDLKASNVLLDSEMNPKISDFGLARIFSGEQMGEMTNRIVGTYGYMPPEYALKGHFSVKSDVFSFGVLLLELISGHKNWGFHHSDHDLNLLGHAWKLWSEGRPLDLLDEVIRESASQQDLIRCIQVGLLCVQQRVHERPTMSSVIHMLTGDNSDTPQPKEPGFSAEGFHMSTDSSSSMKNPQTPNTAATSPLNAR
ncbi:hypothetical protein MLD38_016775 [Melastoma candidum]|uniref:Uncharacterized protein n=1 Tax=Melastoma candidum TaxID=119954 RepID=A0ACB9QNM8_9MYRT|nr:hypothetical protein MLD38_016775 [Melastoma candidum]